MKEWMNISVTAILSSVEWMSNDALSVYIMQQANKQAGS